MSKDIAASVAIMIATAIKNERERIATILEESEAEYWRDYGHGGGSGIDWDRSMKKIANKIRKP